MAVKDPDPDPDPDPDDGSKTFTQEDVDRIVKDRLARVKPTTPDDYADLKKKALKLDELEAANQTEMEKVLARAEAAEKSAADATERARLSDIRSAVTASASTAGAVDIDAVLALLPKDAVTIGDDGQVTGADDAVLALLESKPYLVGTTNPDPKPKPKGNTDGGPRGSGDEPKQLSRADLSSMNAEQIEAARKAGQLSDLMTPT